MTNALSQLGEVPTPWAIIPYARNRNFTGRKDLIERVRGLANRSGHNRIALYGLGGSGKTQIALEYLCQCESQKDRHVFWVQGSGVVGFSKGYRAVAQRVRIPGVSTEADEEGFLLGVKQWFEGPSSGNWILVVDNADNDEDFKGNSGPIAKFVPQCPKGTLIFTTRSRQVAIWQECETVDVGKMEKDEAQALFTKHFGHWRDLRDGEDEVNDKRMKELLSRQFSNIQREVDVTESILSTYFITFDRITKQMPTAGHLLRLIAFFDRQNIPEQLLRECGIEGMDDSIEFRPTIGKLSGFSLVTTFEREGKTFYELHRLIQLSIQAYLLPEELHKWSTAALGVISRIFPKYKHELRDICEAYIPHALVVTKGRTDPTAEDLCFRVGECLLYLGSYNRAEVQIRQCIRLGEENKEHFSNNHYRRLIVNNLATLLEYQGKYNESETMHRRALELRESVLGPDHPETLTSVNNLANALEYQGKYDESEKMSRYALKLSKKGSYDESEILNRRAMEGREKILEPGHPHLLTSFNNLAIVWECQGRYVESEAMHRRALEGLERNLGPDHPDTLTCVNNLTTVLKSQGKYDESAEMSQRALAGLEKIFGPDHPNTLTSVNNLASVLEGQGKYGESEAMNRRALKGREKVLGPDHPYTISSLDNLAIVLEYQGKYDESETMNRRALEVREKVLGPDHPHTLTTLHNLAFALRHQGKYGESEVLNRRALEGRERILEPDHLDTLTSTNNLAVVLEYQGKYDESATMNRRALEGREKALGPEHRHTLTSLNNLAVVLRCQGKYDESETINRRALEGHEKALGRDHLDTLTSTSNLAVVLEYQGKYDESATMNRRVLEGHERILGTEHPHTLTSLNNLAVVLRCQGNYDESETMNRRTLELRDRVLGPDHPDTLVSVNNLAVVLLCQGKYDESEAMMQRARRSVQQSRTGYSFNLRAALSSIFGRLWPSSARAIG
ncbi:TPR-like protein [Tuber magnatum]|uniref:TPR-like protein n=1 Tax=Tuber magnatum TaxID=42249 RepID=A0A317SKR5_9PEZI|nr:TPR-like protein [Tuber magnatum]